MKNIADIFPLSPMQQGMLFHSQLAPETGMYVEQVTCVLKGNLNAGAFSRAWQRVIERHPILRTAFVIPEGKDPVQVVYRGVTAAFQQEDWTALPAGEQQERLSGFLEAERERGFDFASAPLMRLALFRMGALEWQFVWTYHHILLDGWSTPLVFHDVMAYYQAFSQNRDLFLELPRGYRDYIVWLKRQDMARAEAYWRSRLAGYDGPVSLSALQPQGHAFADGLADEHAEAGVDSSECEVWIPEGQVQRLQAAARQLNLTLNTMVNAAWALLLNRLSREEDVCYGVTVSGRPPDLPGAEQIVGLFINTLPVRVRIDPHQPAAAFLRDLQTQLVEMRQYEYTPLVNVQRWSGAPGNVPLFETILVYENYPIQSLMQQADPSAEQPGADSLTIEQVQSVEKTNYPLTAVAGTSGELMLKLLYDRARFSPAWIEQMLRCWAALLKEMADRPGTPVGSLSLLDSDERQHILVEWNRTGADFPVDRCAYQLFEARAAETPNAAALDFDGEIFSYSELNRRANQLAHYLIRMGVTVESRVGLFLERSVDVIVAMLGVMKAGGAYVPIDPAYPPDRLALMIEDSGVQLLLTHRHLVESIPAGDAPVVAVDDCQPLIAREPDENPTRRTAPGSLAYIIYTSGSTGKPKGVLLEHRGLCNLAVQYSRAIGIGPGDRMLQFFSYSFDGSVADIFVALTSGATLCMGRAENLLPGPRLANFLRDRRVTHGMMTPSALAALPVVDLPDLRVLLTGGEACTREIIEPWANGRKLINAYGPTEATVVSTLYEVDDIARENRDIPIGYPLANSTLYILDGQMQPVPVGAAGEVYVGGVGIARGYGNRPELTGERFLPDPFSGVPGARIYRTGDLACFREDGSVMFLGRVDDQVKVRGFRIELGEIESALARHPLVRQAVVMAREDTPGAKRLVGYVVPAQGDPAEPPDPELNSVLTGFLKQNLPAYMVPSLIVPLTALPLTPSGKVDRRALPCPEVDRSTSTVEFLAPRDEVEAQLCAIWEEVLQVRPIGVQDNFFDLGGHSLLAVRVMTLVQKKLGKDLDLISLLQAQTIEQLANVLRAGSEMAQAVDAMLPGQQPEMVRAEAEASSPVITLQKHGSQPPIYFVHPSGGSTHWYMDLAAALGKDQPFYAFQALGVKGDQPIHTTIEAMADYYVRALRAFQPHGPYKLGSWSLGVIIAYEMARRLQQQGETVSFLAMLDQGPNLPLELTSDQAEYLVQTFGENIPLNVEELRALTEEEQIKHVYEKGRRIRFILPDMRLKDFARFVHMLHTQVSAWRSYQPAPYAGKITLFRAIEQDHPTDLGPDLGWRDLAQGGVEICEVPGDHLTMIHKPHVKKLAAAMKQLMKEICYG